MYAYAATEAQIVAQGLLSKINEAILFPLITLMMAAALLIFLYGAFEYVKGASNDSDREKGKQHLLYGTIGMLVMLSAMSILYVAAGTFGLDDELDDAANAGKSWNGGFFGFTGKNDRGYYDDRAPSMNTPIDDSKTSKTGDVLDKNEDPYSDRAIAEDPNNPFNSEQPMSETLLRFHQGGLHATAEIKAITATDIVSSFYVVDGQYPDDYSRYEDTVLLPFCEAKGGADVFSIDANNSMGRIFFCVQ
jgi:hypothetical protein